MNEWPKEYSCEYPYEFEYLPEKDRQEIKKVVEQIKSEIIEENKHLLEYYLDCIEREVHKIDTPEAFHSFVLTLSNKLTTVSEIFKNVFDSVKQRISYRLHPLSYSIKNALKRTGKRVSMFYNELSIKALEPLLNWFLSELDKLLGWIRSKLKSIKWHEAPSSISLGVSTGIPPSISLSLSWDTKNTKKV